MEKPDSMIMYQVDVFTHQGILGNPAAVVPLEYWPEDAWMQVLARDIKLSETAFFVPTRQEGCFELRWFTPQVEVELCGHATLATAFVLRHWLEFAHERAEFQIRNGRLMVDYQTDAWLEIDLPAYPPRIDENPRKFHDLGLHEVSPVLCLRSNSHILVLENETLVRAFKPDMGKIAGLDLSATIVTAPGDETDYVLRYFAPAAGVPEDPATGSAHCTLVPYWSQRLGLSTLTARQLSERGGYFKCQDLGKRVRVAGRCSPRSHGIFALAG